MRYPIPFGVQLESTSNPGLDCESLAQPERPNIEAPRVVRDRGGGCIHSSMIYRGDSQFPARQNRGGTMSITHDPRTTRAFRFGGHRHHLVLGMASMSEHPQRARKPSTKYQLRRSEGLLGGRCLHTVVTSSIDPQVRDQGIDGTLSNGMLPTLADKAFPTECDVRGSLSGADVTGARKAYRATATRLPDMRVNQRQVSSGIIGPTEIPNHSIHRSMTSFWVDSGR